MGDIVITPASNDVNSTGGTLNIRASDAYPLLLKTSNVERISITAAGLVGIGTTAPTGKLHIYSSITGDTLLRADGTNGTIFSVTDDLSNSLLSVNNSAGIPVLEVFADDSVVMGQYGSGDFVLRNNKIGIGTTNPAYKLEVNGNFAAGGTSTIGTTYPQLTLNGATNQHAHLLINRTNYEAAIQLQTNGVAKWYMYMPAADDTTLRFNSQAYGDSLTIKNNGNVGIGTTNPSFKLHTAGAGFIGRQNSYGTYDAADADLIISNYNSDNTSILLFNSAGAYNSSLINYYNNILSLGLNNDNSSNLILTSTSINITAAGVGIGTSVITGLLNATRNSNTAQPIAFFKELFTNPAATNLLLLERGNNLSAANQISSNAGLRIRDHSSNYSLSIEDHNSNVNFAISGTRVLVGSTTATSLLNIGGAGSTLPASGITFGGDAQANLYRVTEDTIRTDGSFIAVGSLDVGNGITSSSQFRLGTYLGYISTYPSIATAAFRWVILGPYNDTLSVAGNGLRVRGELFFSRGSNSENLRNARLKINIAQGYNKDLLHADVLSIDSDTTTAQPILYSVYLNGFTSKYFAIDASQLVSFSASELDASTVYYNGQFYDQSNDARALTIQPNTAVTGAIGVVSRGGKIANALFAYTGNIGIGTVTPAYTLDVFGSSSADVGRFYNNSASCNFYIGSTNNTTATALVLYTSNGNGQIFKNRSSTSWGGADSLNIYTSNGGIAFHPAGETNAVYFANNGRVGIGTTNPAEKLHLYSTTDALLRIDGGSGYEAGLLLSASGINKWEIYRVSSATNSLNFYNYESASSILTLTSSNVGVGTAPNAKLHIHGNTNDWSTSPTIIMSSSSVAGANVRNWRIGPADTVYGNFHIGVSDVRGGIVDSNAEAGAFTITYDQNVGIGLTNPSSKLHVAASAVVATLNSTLASSSSISTLLYRNVDGNSNPYSIASIAGESAGNGGYGSLIFSTAFNNSLVERMRINTNGNVGVGLTNSSDKIQISGGGISFTTSTGLAVPMLGMTSLNVAYVGPYNSPADGNSPTVVLFNHARSVQQTWFYASGTIAMSLNGQGRFHIGGLNNAPPALLNVGPTSSVAATGGMSFGNDASANLYRSAASTIKTDGSLEVTTSLNIGADLYVADELGVGVLIADKRVNYGAQINAASASIQLVLGRTTSSTGQGAIGADSANTFAVWNVSGGFTKQLVVTQQGNVGIGTDTPSQKLHVYARGNGAGILIESDATVDANQAPALKLYPKSPSVNERNWAISPFRDYPQSLSIASSNDKGGDPYSNATTRILIDGLNGNVGIGTVLPDSLLHVHGGNPFVRISNSAGSDQGIKITYGNSDTHGLHLLYNANSALSYIDNTYPIDAAQVWGDILFRQNVAGTMTTRIIIKGSNGNVGIGATNPSNKTTIEADAAGVSFADNAVAQLVIRGATDTTKRLGLGVDTTSNIGVIQAQKYGTAAYPLALNPVGGNVGIGTTSPATTLDVNGTTFLRGNLNAGKTANLNTTTALNGTGGGNRGFDTSFTGASSTGFTGSDSTDQGFGYFAATIVSGRSYEVSATMVVTNGAPLSFITSSGLNFATQTVQSIISSPVSNTIYRFVATADAAFFGIGINRTSGTMTAVVSNVSVKEVGSVLVASDSNVGIGATSPLEKLDVRGGILRTNTRINNSESYPLGHYSSGETVFEIDPTWSQAELQKYFNSSNVTWVAVADAPGGYCIYVDGAVQVGGFMDSGFPYIPVDTDDIFYMECWIQNVGVNQTHYMGSQDLDHNFSDLGGNPGSYGYFVMSNSNPTTTWTKFSGYIGGFSATETGKFEIGTKYWTPLALFNYTAGTGTRACRISGWKVIKVYQPGNRYFSGNIGIGTTSPTQKLDIVGSYGTPDDNAGILKIKGPGVGPTQLNFGVSADGGYAWIQATDISIDNDRDIILGPLGGDVGIGTTNPLSLLTVGAAGSTTAAKGLSFGGDAQANLYRSAEDTVKTDGNLIVVGNATTASLDVAGTIRLSSNLLSHKTASYTTPYPGISSFGADATDSALTYYDTGKLVISTNIRGVVWTGKHYIFTDYNTNRAYFYDNNFVQITNAYGYYFVTLPLPSGYPNPHGAAWDGRYLWCVVYVNAATSSKIVGYDLDTTNQTATIIAESAAITAVGFTYDIEYADGHLYLVRGGTLFIYKWNGSSIDAVSNYPGAAGTIDAQAITYDGSYLWVTQNGAAIYKVGLDGTPLATINTITPNVCGWAWNGSNIVTFNYAARNIYIINTTRLRIDTQNLALMGGNVGIGSTSPAFKLDVLGDLRVSGTTSTVGSFRSSATSCFISLIDSSNDNVFLGNDDGDFLIQTPTTSYSTKLIVKDGGNVGIGTNSPYSLLDVQVASASPKYVTISTNDGQGSYYGFGLNFRIADGAHDIAQIRGIYENSNGGGYGGLAIATRSAGVLYNRVSFTDQGRVGIGTSSPTTILSVGGPGSTTAASGITLGGDSVANLYRISASRIKTDGFLTIDGGGGGATNLLLNRSSSSNENGMAFTTAGSVDWYYYVDNGTTNLQIQRGGENDAAPRVRFNGANSDILFNLGGGNIGVGTATPTGKLHIYSTITGQTLIRADGTNGTIFSVVDDLSNSLLSVNNSAGIPVLEVFADDSIVMGQYGSGDLVVASNKVGIGTTNPNFKLTVNGDINILGTTSKIKFNGVDVINTAGGGNGDMYLNGRVIRAETNSYNDGMYIGYNSAGTTSAHLRFYANGATERMRIQANDGHVGIGTTTAAGRLDVYNDTNGDHILFVRNNNGGSNAFSSIQLRRDGGNNGLVMFTNSSTRTADGGAGNSTLRADTNKLLLGAGGVTYHSLETNGNVGIGLTNPSAARLHIKGDTSNPPIRVETNLIESAAGGTAGRTLRGWLPIMTGANATDKVYIPLFGPLN